MKSTGRALLCQPFRAMPNAIFSSLHLSISPLNRWQTGSFEEAVTAARSLPRCPVLSRQPEVGAVSGRRQPVSPSEAVGTAAMGF